MTKETIKISLTFLLLFVCINSSYSQLYINEVMPSNATVLADQAGEFDDWLEIYNAGGSSVNLAGYYISDDPLLPTKWQIPSTNSSLTTVTGGGYLILWADDDEDQGEDHLNFKLSGSGETISLYASNGSTLIDQLTFTNVNTDNSYGHNPDGTGPLQIFANSSPNDDNANGLPRADKVEFSIAGGFYGSSQTVSLSSTTPGATIRYELDGSEPTSSSPVYSSALTISASSPLRAKAFKSGFIESKVSSEFYILNYTTDNPVICISTAPDSIFGNTHGIYPYGTNGITGRCQSTPVNWNQDWEREINFIMYESDGTQVINQEAGLEIAGGCSRRSSQKSFNVKAKEKFGVGDFDHQFFPDYSQDSYKRIKLRNGGQLISTSALADGLGQRLVRDELEVDALRWRPVVVFINGQYWGQYGLRDQFSEHYIDEQHKICDKDNIDLIEAQYSAANSVQAGTEGGYASMYTWMDNNSLSSAANYATASDFFNVDNFIDYNIAQCFFSNTDWPGNNSKMWKEQGPNGKWRYMLFDTDFGYGRILNASSRTYSGYDNTMLDFMTNTTLTGWPNDPNTTMFFRRFLENQSFEEEFIQRFATYLNTVFLTSHTQSVLADMKTQLTSERAAHYARWNGNTTYGSASNQTVSGWNTHVANVDTWLGQRQPFMFTHIQSFFGLGGTFTLNLPVTTSTGGRVVLNDNEFLAPYNYSGTYFDNVPFTIKAIPEPGFKFSHWAQDNNTNPVRTVNRSSNWTRTPVFVPAQALVINEIHYHPIIGQVDEFIEIYNPDSDAKDLSGYEFTNGITYTFPEGTSIAADEYIIIANNASTYLGNGYQVFEWWKKSKLDNGGESIVLSNPYGSAVDSVKYDDLLPWVTDPDGSGPSLALVNSNLNNELPASWDKQNVDITPGAINSFCSPLSFNNNISQPQCFGVNDGTATISASGGNGPYTYAWSHGPISNSVSNLAPGSYIVTVTDAYGCPDTETITIQAPPSALSVSTSKTNPLCNGINNGTASASATGGNAGYSYSWSNGANTASISNLAPGSYTVTVTDANGCQKNKSVNIAAPPAAIVLSTSKTNPLCNGINNGTASASATGGIAGYSYSWSNGANTANISNLAPGSYTVTVTDANGCQKNKSVNIAAPPAAIVISTSKTNPLCNGINNGTASASATGGNAGYSYSWSNGANTANISNLAPGSYTVTVTDANGCQKNKSVNIAAPPAAIAVNMNTIDPICAGVDDGTASASVTGGAGPFTYSWSNGGSAASIANLAPGNYTVTVTDNNACSKTQSITINPPANVLSVSSVDSDPSVLGAGDGSITLMTTGPSVSSYAWSNGATGSFINGLTPGTYTATITDVNGCTTIHTSTISPGPQLPVASASFTPNNGVAPITISFNALGSIDPDGSIVAYNWDFGDGSTGTGAIPSHNFANPGLYTVTLVITDSQGLTDTITLNVNILDTCDPPTNLTLISASSNTLIVNWQGDSQATSYNLRYRDASIGGSWTNFPTSGTTAIITGLNDCSDYEIKVSNQCSFNLQSGFSVTEIFSTTNCFTCTAPLGLYQFNIQNISAIITWDVLVGATSYTYKFRKVGDTNWISQTTTFPIAVLFGISGCTDYEWTMETTCFDGSTAQSPTINNFTTQCKNEGEEIVLLEQSEIQIYPNPSSDKINLILPESNAGEIQIFNQNGQIVYSKNTNSTTISIDVSDWTNGLYIVKCKNYQKTFIKN